MRRVGIVTGAPVVSSDLHRDQTFPLNTPLKGALGWAHSLTRAIAITMTSPSTKRRDMDLMKLMMSDYEVRLGDEDSTNEFYVKLEGPADSPYNGGVWTIHVTLPAEYPYKSPSIGFCNRVFHPNVDAKSGSVCLDVINQTWSPMFDLVNIFSVFLPQLLMYPNAHDPLNGEAGGLYIQDRDAYLKKVREYVEKYAMEAPDPCSLQQNSNADSGHHEDDVVDDNFDEEFSDVEDIEMDL